MTEIPSGHGFETTTCTQIAIYHVRVSKKLARGCTAPQHILLATKLLYFFDRKTVKQTREIARKLELSQAKIVDLLSHTGMPTAIKNMLNNWGCPLLP